MLKRMTSAAGLLVAACSLALLARPARAAPGVEVSIIVVRASATGEPYIDPAIDETIVKRFGKLAQFKRFTAEREHAETVAWGQKATLVLADGGRFEATARQAAETGKVQLDMSVPGAGQPCLETSMSGKAGQRHLVFCDAPSTLLFFVAAKPSP